MSLLELVIALLILSILMGSAVSNLAQIKNPLKDGVSETLGFVKQVRARALSTTSAYTLFAVSSTQIGTRYAAACDSATTTPDGSLMLQLPTDVSLPDTDWTICFSGRGLAQGAGSFSLRDTHGDSETLEVFLGGAVRIRP